jgi:hypothetical protein
MKDNFYLIQIQMLSIYSLNNACGRSRTTFHFTFEFIFQKYLKLFVWSHLTTDKLSLNNAIIKCFENFENTLQINWSKVETPLRKDTVSCIL